MRRASYWLCAFLASVPFWGAEAFNLDLLHPIVYHSRQTFDYFGFGVALHPGGSDPTDLPWIMVGAPKANDSVLRKDVGVVYKCHFKGKCDRLKVDYSEGANMMRQRYTLDLGGAMTGSVMDMSADRFVVCSPRWKVRLSHDAHNFRMYGVCYWGMSKKADREVEAYIPLAPAGNKNKDILDIGGVGYPDYMWGQAGFSAHLFNNSQGSHQMLLGAPSVRNWVGTTVTYQDGSDASEGLARRRRKRTPANAFSKGPFIPDPGNSRDIISKYGLFGYSVTSGRYFSRSDLVNIAGAPSTFPAGKIFAYTLRRQQSDFQMIDILQGTQAGEYFGSSLATGDINGDGFDDLVVGAPQFTQWQEGVSTQNEGRVLVFLGSGKQKFELPSSNHEIKGQVINGRLGTTVACIGDIDLDGYHDFGFSAPYMGSGVVFIYRGSLEGLKLSQRIIGSEIQPDIAGFGFGISRGQDIDKNGYNDIAIGAYKSGHAVVIRSKPVIDMVSSITILGDKLREDARELNVEICVHYFGMHAPQQIRVAMVLNMDPGYFRIYKEKTNQALSTSKEVITIPIRGLCGKIKLLLKDNIKNFLAPIKITGEFYLAPESVTKSSPLLIDGSNTISGRDDFCPHCPLLRGKSQTKIAEIGFFLGCRNEAACIADLSLEIRYVNSKNQIIPQFVIGSQETLSMIVTLTNSGDPSFNTKLVINMPSIPISMPASCQDTSNTSQISITCDAGNPIKANTKRDFPFRLDTLNVLGSAIQTEVEAVSATPFERPQEAIARAALTLISEADVTIYGKSHEENYRYDSENEEKKESKVTAVVSYHVEKSGISPLKEVVMTIDIPYALDNGDKFLHLSPPKFTMNSRPLVCDHNSDLVVADKEAASAGQTFSQSESIASATGGDMTGVRARRDTTTSQFADSAIDADKYPANRTLFVNCSSSDWKCSRLVCRTELNFEKLTADLTVRMHLDMTKLEIKMGQKDILVFGTTAVVEIADPRGVQQPLVQNPDVAHVSVILLRRIPMGKVETWVIALSAIGGILLLLLLTMGLVKAGFFQRKQRDELLLQKRQTEMAAAGDAIAQQGEVNTACEEEIPTK